MALISPLGRSVAPCTGTGIERRPCFIMMWWLPEILSRIQPCPSSRFFNSLPVIACWWVYSIYAACQGFGGVFCFKKPRCTVLVAKRRGPFHEAGVIQQKIYHSWPFDTMQQPGRAWRFSTLQTQLSIKAVWNKQELRFRFQGMVSYWQSMLLRSNYVINFTVLINKPLDAEIERERNLTRV